MTQNAAAADLPQPRVTCANCGREITKPPWNLFTGRRRAVWCTSCCAENRLYARREGWRREPLVRTACTRCGAKMRVHHYLVGWRRVELCPLCQAAQQRERANESARTAKRNRAATLRALAGQPVACTKCKRELAPDETLWRISGYEAVPWSEHKRRWRVPACADCAAKEQRDRDESSWATSVEQGTPGTYTPSFFGGPREVLDPSAPDYDPLVEIRRDRDGVVRDPDTCEVCGREVVFGFRVRDRREVVYCDFQCEAEAIRLSRRVPVREPQPCEWCEEMFTPSRAGARFCCSAHRVAAFRARRAS